MEKKKFRETLDAHPWLKDNFVKDVFDHLRNIFLCAVFAGAGAYFLTRPTNDPALFKQIVGMLMLLTGCALFVVNALHGIKKLAQSGINKVALVAVTLVLFFPAVVFFELIFRRGP